MADKPTYEELEQRVRELEEKSLVRKPVERDLKIFQTAVESSINAIVITDKEGKLIYANDTCVKLWGYNSKDELLGRSLPEFLEGDDVFKTINELRDKCVAVGEDIGKRKDGSLFFVLFTASMFIDEADGQSFMFGSFFDITEQKQAEEELAEEALRESEERYRLIVENMNDLIVKFDAEGRLTYVSPPYCKIFGKSEEELLGGKFMPLIHEDDRDRVAESLRNLFREPYTCQHDERSLTVDGWRWFSWSNRAFLDGKGRVKDIIAVGRDITKRRMAEEKLHETERYYLTLFDSAPVGIWHADINGNGRYGNKKLEEIMGLNSGNMTGNGWTSALHPDDREKVFKAWTDLVKHGIPYHSTYRFVHSDNRERWVIGDAQPVQGSDGEKLGYIGIATDITGRKMAEKELRESEEKYRRLIETLTEGIWGIDAEGTTTFVNPKMAEMLGYTVEEMMGEHLFSFMTDDWVKRAKNLLGRRRRGITDQHEFMFRKKSGESIYTLMNASPIFDNRGNFSGAVAGVNDITDRKRVERELEASEARFRGIFENTMNGVAVYQAVDEGEDFIFLDINKAGEMISKVARETVMGQSVVKLFPGIRDIGLLSVFQQVWKTGQSVYTPAINYRDDRISQWVENMVYKLPSGEIVAVYRDVSHSKETEDNLRTAELRYRTVADFTYDWEWWKNPDGSFNYVSPSCARFTGYNAEEFIADPGLMERIVLEEDRHVWTDHMSEEGADLQFQDIQFRIRKRDGTICVIEHACQSVKDEKGNFLGIRASNRDITGRRKAQEETRQLRKEVAHMDRVTLMGELAASLAHEINQPLTAIMSNAQAAQRFLNREEPDFVEVKEILADIISDDKRAGDVIRRLRALFKKTEVDRISIDINRMLEDTLAIIKSEAIIRNVSIQMESDDTLPPVIGDSVQLQQVILNLIINASEAMSDLNVHSRKVVIAAEKADQKSVRVSVRDIGPGIDADRFDRAFEPFFTTKPEGIGMGLSISKSIIEAHGGKMWAENHPDGGAVFYLTLPAYKET